jgi:hypothetical protein
MIKKATKKPVTIDYILLTSKNIKEVYEFVYGDKVIDHTPNEYRWSHFEDSVNAKGMDIPTLEDGMDNRVVHVADIGDYIIKGIKGEFYPCKPDIFEMTYKIGGLDDTNNLTFGEAIGMLKLGFKVARSGWNGRGMFVVYQKGYPDGIPCNKNTAEAWGMNEGDIFKVRPYLQLKTADGSHAMWSPSTSDCLSEDWCIVN